MTLLATNKLESFYGDFQALFGIDFEIQRGETIWTETSHKYSQSELVEIAQRTGFRCQGQWIDDEWGFAENLWIAR